MTRHPPAGLRRPALGLGGAQLGNLDVAITDEEAADVVHAAWDAGLRYFDTAPHYGLGLSERRLGSALRAYPRREFVVSTKVGRWLEPGDDAGQADPEGFVVPATHRRRWDFSRDGVLRSIEARLDRLVLDRIDLVLIHDPDDHVGEALETAAPTLSQLRSEGVIGGYGVGIINAGIFNSGLLSRPRPRPGDQYDYGPVPDHVLERTTRIARLCKRFGVDLPTAALAFARRHPAVASVVVGLRTPTQLRELVARWDRSVPEDLWTALEERGLVPPIPS